MIQDMEPCPFCGSTNLHDAYVTIRCLDCLAQGPATNGGKNDAHADWPDHEQAIELWNKAVRQ